jgi:hypothetical protein
MRDCCMLTEPFKEMFSIPSAGSRQPTSREDRKHSADSRFRAFRAVRAFGGFQKRVESQSVQCPDFRVDALNSSKRFSSGTIRKCDIRL